MDKVMFIGVHSKVYPVALDKWFHSLTTLGILLRRPSRAISLFKSGFAASHRPINESLARRTYPCNFAAAFISSFEAQDRCLITASYTKTLHP